MADLTQSVPCHSQRRQLLNSIYALNKSFTKKILVSLDQCNDYNDVHYEPTVRLIASDFIGIAFSISQRNSFKSTFDDIIKYFDASADELFEQKIYGDGWILKFTRCHSEKAIEVEEDRRSGSKVPVKCFRQSIVMKR